jgi:Leucine-rich repeat (LRR) protein
MLFIEIDISGNRFTGTLPYDLFNTSTSLVLFAAVKNCITGSIPESICHCRSIRSLAMDGLHASGHCQSRIFPFLPQIIKTYQLKKDLPGSIPSCIYSMPSLKTLHLSGNGIKGSIPSSIVLGDKLTDLSLSHNLIKGTIPEALQQHQFSNLDLSFNQIGGTLMDDFAQYSVANSSLALQVNRLSGGIPQSLLNLNDISILQGNIFRCVNGEDSLPQHDQYVDSYVCGSDAVNSAMFV